MSAVLVMSSDSYAEFLGHLICTVGDTLDQEGTYPPPKEDASPPQNLVSLLEASV